MIVHEGYKDVKIKNSVAALGVFDGMHRGHVVLVRKTVEKAKELGVPSVVLTFDKLPRMVLRSSAEGISLLSSIDEKKSIIGELGVDYMLILPFTKEFSMMTAQSFIEDVLVDKLGCQCLVVGRDHRFGYDGSGNDSTIDEYAKKWNMSVERVPGLTIDGTDVSSSKIRDLLANGDVEQANIFLGRRYSISGDVIKGRRLGHAIGYPTANVNLSDKDKMIPADGVYAVETIVEGKMFGGMMSIGSNPTVKSDAIRSLEVNMFDFDKDIYGQTITVSFVKRLRQLRKYDNVEKLSDQLSVDKIAALEALRVNGIF